MDNNQDLNDIASLFKNKYGALLNDPNSQVVPDYHPQKTSIPHMETTQHVKFSDEEILNAIFKLKPGISADNIHSSYLKLGSNNLFEFLKMFLNSMLAHSYVPKILLEGSVKPRVKNRFGSRIDSANYRPVMTSSVILKVLELCLEPHLRKYLQLDTSQFGFRNNTSTTMAACIFKENIRHYTDNGSKVFCAFLDLKAAFDKVNHKKTFKKIRCCWPTQVSYQSDSDTLRRSGGSCIDKR